MKEEFYQRVEKILKRDARYKVDAYQFMMQALSYTQTKLKRLGHVTGKELLEGIREYALEQFGPMSKTVLEHWGIRDTSDFGEIVFNMVEEGLMGKREEDKKEDFKDVYDFRDAFIKEYKHKLEEQLRRQKAKKQNET